ncbi:CaiB/BaiF CoA-transferase family protein [Rhodoferax sp.]|uniref:CaiB/BaiF CoA transferase family protein n=1 Tax=Rhodoferax sp. TaxID=50421 RepID=UPI00261AFB43|nr:CaiB/BaiF CoA-transferase family protein [Rhodoferax sp.]MDD2808801.1 CaiB/BaiF CoA-transferase family protein [Rhodoferax sp.]MDD5478069.1 CaiB/BaiF CoA-transferase family protein [Rhodoferax sp.]
MTTTPPAALSHLKVLDLSRVLAGPWCTQMLADLGADVVKVERPGAGDDTRHWGPPFLQDAQGADTDLATYYTACNRNKRAITLDIAQPDGQALIKQLAAQSDVLVENFKVGGLKAYGLDFESLHAVNPKLIYCSVTGFGQSGPYAERAGYDLMIQAMSGMMSLTGHADGEPGGGPLRMGVALIDILTGIYACSAILAAIESRHRTGLGQHIDMALLDVGMAVLANQAAGFLNTGRVPQRQGNAHPSLAPYQTFDTLDGQMLLAVGNDGQFSRFCEAAGHPEWAADARFASNALRVQHRSALVALLHTVTRSRSTAQWVSLLEDKAVPCGPINDLAQAFADPQVQARGLVVNQPVAPVNSAQAAIESISTVASPLRLQSTPPVLQRAPPALGEHTAEVLSELGLSPQAVAELRRKGVV